MEQIELVRKAQQGDKSSLNKLAEIARTRLSEHVKRMTLDDELTNDIVQESILEMYKVFDKLNNSERFWGWLFGIANNKTLSHYGRKWRQKTVSLADVEGGIEDKTSPNGLTDLVTAELKQVVVQSMQQLSPQHRAILNMRCYNSMSYAKIAKTMDCGEIKARVMFHRAKKSLVKELSRRGFGKGFVLMALVIFGKLTATSEAAAASISVTAATLKVGLVGTVIGIAASKATIATLATAAVLAAGTAVVMDSDTKQTGHTPMAVQAKSISTLGPQQFDAMSRQEWWCWYRHHDRDSVIVRVMQCDKDGKYRYCNWKQDQGCNYVYDSGQKTVYITNNRYWSKDLSVSWIPTSSKKMREFLSANGKDINIQPARDGLLVKIRFDEAGLIDVDPPIYHVNLPLESYFLIDWPKDVQIIDKRDTMHQRGWTWFTVNGRIGDKDVTGRGRMPFVNDTCDMYYPWLSVTVGDTEYVDYNGETLFEGLSRPWEGLHTIDAVRTDAAKQGISHNIELADDGSKALVTLDGDTEMVYTIDMGKDLVEEITFTGAVEGWLEFSYQQQIDESDYEFTEPKRNVPSDLKDTGRGGIHWLINLAREN